MRASKIEEHAMSDQFFVRGQILDEAQVAVSGVRVALFGHGRRGAVALGVGLSKDNGRFTVTASPGMLKRYEGLRSLSLRLSRGGESLEALEGVTQWAAKVSPGSITLVVPSVLDNLNQTAWQVSGYVRHADGTGVVGAQVRFYHRKLGADVLVDGGDPVDFDEGGAVTGAEGSYTFEFPVDPSTPLNLYALAYDGQGEPLGRSRVIPRATKSEELDVVLLDDARRSPSEFQRLDAALDLSNVQVGALTVEDVRLIHIDLEGAFSPEAVTAYIASLRMSQVCTTG